MSLDRPFALALLAIPVVLLWLRLRAQRPRDAEASSLLVWQKVSSSDTPPTRPRPPLAAWLETAGAALLVVGIAQPWLTGSAPEAVRVVVDISPSMKGREVPPEAATGQPSTNIEVDLPPLLATPGPVVVVTDHRTPAFPDMPGRLRVIGVGTRGFNAGITAASGAPIGDGRWRLFLTVEAHGAPGPVEGRLRIDGREESITVAPGKPLEVVRNVASEPTEARIEFVGDVLAADDRVAWTSRGGNTVELFGPGISKSDPFCRALLAAGTTLSTWEAEEEQLGLLTAGGRFPLTLDIPPASAETEPVIEGASVVVSDHPLVRDVRIDPSSSLGRIGRQPLSGTTLLSGPTGPLVSLMTGHRMKVCFAFRPGGTWVERDPSFVVFAKNLVEYAAGGPARLVASGVLDPKETREAAEGETFGDLAAALAEARRSDPASRASLAAIVLAVAASLLASAWFAGRHR